MRKLFVTVACLAALGACAQTTSGGGDAEDTCGAAEYEALIGTNVAAVTFPADRNIRIIGPNQVVTQDFSAERLNVITDADGVITSLRCY